MINLSFRTNGYGRSCLAMNEILQTVLQIVATTVAVITLIWRLLKSHEKKLAEIMQRQLDHELKVDARINQMGRDLDEQCRKDVRDLHNCINEFKGNTLQQLNQRLSSIEGEMKGVRNILGVIQGHFINKGDRG